MLTSVLGWRVCSVQMATCIPEQADSIGHGGAVVSEWGI